MADLKPCPFCGSTNISSGESLNGHMGNYSKQTACEDCGALGPEAPVTLEQARGPVGDDLADAAWNRRADDSGVEASDKPVTDQPKEN
jgi:Lar family restriction alleviation protein